MTDKLILVIDDEIDIREIARISLEMSKGWRVLTASSGRAGLKVAAQEKPDAILLDANMPDMDGWETLQNLKECIDTREIPVILLTGNVQATVTPDYARSGAKAVLLKPFDPAKLANRVEEILAWVKCG